MSINVGFISIHHNETALLWRHNGHDSVSNHQPHDCLLNRLFRRRSKKISKLRVTGLCAENIHRVPVNSPHKWPVTRKMLPFDDFIMRTRNLNPLSWRGIIYLAYKVNTRLLMIWSQGIRTHDIDVEFRNNPVITRLILIAMCFWLMSITIPSINELILM